MRVYQLPTIEFILDALLYRAGPSNHRASQTGVRRAAEGLRQAAVPRQLE